MGHWGIVLSSYKTLFDYYYNIVKYFEKYYLFYGTTINTILNILKQYSGYIVQFFIYLLNGDYTIVYCLIICFRCYYPVITCHPPACYTGIVCNCIFWSSTSKHI